MRKFAALLALPLLIELCVRVLSPQDALSRQADKIAHCPDASGYMFYCPNVRIEYRGKRAFKLTTNELGERITGSASTGPEIWLLGDSIVSGFGLDDASSAPFLIAQSGVRVRNMAVDGLGPAGTLSRFQENLASGKPARAYYLFDFSEFEDVAREESFASSRTKRFFLSADTIVSRYSLFYCLLRSARTQPAPVHSAAASSVSPDHPAFTILRSLLHEAKKSGVEMAVIVYAGGGLDGRPGPDQSYQDLVAATALAEKTTVLDLRSEFIKRSMQETLYIPGDGHPSEAGARIIARAVLEDLKLRPLQREASWK